MSQKNPPHCGGCYLLALHLRTLTLLLVWQKRKQDSTKPAPTKAGKPEQMEGTTISITFGIWNCCPRIPAKIRVTAATVNCMRFGQWQKFIDNDNQNGNNSG